MGKEFQSYKVKIVKELDSGNGCTTLWIYLIPPNCAWLGWQILCVFYRSKNNYIRSGGTFYFSTSKALKGVLAIGTHGVTWLWSWKGPEPKGLNLSTLYWPITGRKLLWEGNMALEEVAFLSWHSGQLGEWVLQDWRGWSGQRTEMSTKVSSLCHWNPFAL